MTEETVQTDADGRAVFEYIPPSLEPLDRTDFEVTGSVEDLSFSCRGSVVTGLGALTASFQGLIDQQKAIALLRRVWDKLIVRVAVGRDAGAMSREFLGELERITREDPAFLAGLRGSVEAHRPLLEQIAAGQQVTASEEALQEFEDLLARLDPREDSNLKRAVGGVRDYLVKARRVALARSTNRRPTSEARLANPAQEQGVLQHRADPAVVRTRTAHDKLQLRFEANVGQVSGDVRYLARGPGYDLYLLPEEAVVVSGVASRGLIGPPSVVRIQLAGSQPTAKPKGVGELQGKSHYLLGKDPANWRTDVPHYAKVKYPEVYPGIDLVYYGRQNQLEYDFVVAPGASPDVISFGFEGVEGLQLGGDGDLVLNVGEADLRLKKPFIYQEIKGARRQIAGDYALREGGLVGFEVEAYDASRPLVIDPILSYSSYVGGAEYDAGGDIAVGPDGSVYLTGATSSINFPTETPLQADSAGGIPVGVDAFVIKLDPSGSEVVYSTYIGGSHIDFGMGIAVDDQGNAFVTGETRSEDFPIAEAMQKALAEAAADPAPAAIEPNLAIRVAMRRRALAERLNFWQWGYYYQQVTGRPQPDAFRYLRPKRGVGEWTVEEIENYEMTADRWWDLMTTPRSGQSKGEPSEIGARSAFVMKLDPTGSSLTYSTYLGGTGDDRGTSIAIDGEGNAYVAGTTASTDFPVRDAIQTVHGGGELFYAFDAFAAKLNAAGTELVFATFLGGSEYDAARGIAVDAAGNAYVSGTTESPNFPTTTDAFQRDGPAVEEEYDAFVTKLDGAGSLLYSTFLGGGSQDFGFAIAVDADGNAYTTGITGSPDFPLLNPVQGQFGSNDLLGFDAFVTKLNAGGTGLIYSTFLGGGGTEIGFGIAVDSDGNTYVAGETDSMDFPTATALQPVTGGRSDGFVTKLDPTGSTLDFSTYLGGGDYDAVQGLALTQDRDVYVAGLSLSSDSPVTFGAFQTSSEGLADALVAKISEGEPRPAVATIQAASGALTVAPDSLASGFGVGAPLADMVASAAEVPLPTELAGVSVRVTDSQGVQRLAGLLFVSVPQTNFYVADNTALGLALVEVLRDGEVIATGTVQVENVAPGIFTANLSGQGVPLALFLRFRGARQTAQGFVYDTTAPVGQIEPVTLDLGDEDEQLFIALFGTGMRRGIETSATIDGEEVPVSPVVALEEFVGLDQANLGPIPRGFIGRGVVELLLIVDGRVANVVTLRF